MGFPESAACSRTASGPLYTASCQGHGLASEHRRVLIGAVEAPHACRQHTAIRRLTRTLSYRYIIYLLEAMLGDFFHDWFQTRHNEFEVFVSLFLSTKQRTLQPTILNSSSTRQTALNTKIICSSQSHMHVDSAFPLQARSRNSYDRSTPTPLTTVQKSPTRPACAERPLFGPGNALQTRSVDHSPHLI